MQTEPVADDLESPLVASATEEVVQELRLQGHRVTTARRLLIKTLIAAGGHRTAEELAGQVHGLAPDVHLSTIYRNLDELERLGVIEHAHLGHGAATYHLAASVHGHLVCTTCGVTIEVPDKTFRSLARNVQADYGFTIDPHHFAMVGLCANCARDEEQAPHSH